MKKRKRNFIIFFRSFYSGEIFDGNEAVQTDGEFPSWKDFVEQMVDARGYDDLLITNIIEVTESDYKDWIN